MNNRRCVFQGSPNVDFLPHFLFLGFSAATGCCFSCFAFCVLAPCVCVCVRARASPSFCHISLGCKHRLCSHYENICGQQQNRQMLMPIFRFFFIAAPRAQHDLFVSTIYSLSSIKITLSSIECEGAFRVIASPACVIHLIQICIMVSSFSAN